VGARPARRAGRRPLCTAAALGCLLAAARALPGDLPEDGPATHLGVAACATALCHNSVVPWQGSRVRQNEYRLWRQRDAHARAHAVLSGDTSRRITANLGWGPAETDDRCLGCHADHVAAERRGVGLRAAEGVGCEACHGGASGWIESHAHPGARHEDNVARGLYPTDDPRRRAELCLSCHFGTSRKFVTHRMLAAGHPRLRFELDTFSQNQPAHYEVDDDYRARKEAPASVKVWALGQAVALRELVRALGERFAREGGWAELALLDCGACHHALGARTPRDGPAGRAPGLLRLDGGARTMLGRILAVLDPAAGRRLEGELLALDTAMTARGPASAPASHIQVEAALDRIAAWTPDPRSLRALLASLLAADAGALGDPIAEQQAMAIQSTLASMVAAAALGAECRAPIEHALDGLFAGIRAPGFDPHAFRRGLDALARSGCAG
jgi:hypothetical protein